MNRWLLRAALALVVGWLFAPAPARASCGDYVRVGGESDHPMPKPSDAPQSPKREQTPCHGPGCSGAPSHEPLASPPTVPVREKEWAALAFPTLLPEPCPLDVLAEYPDRYAVRSSGSVFHPPR